MRPVLEHHDVLARVGELGGDHRPRGSRADHHHVGIEVEIARKSLARTMPIESVPSRLRAIEMDLSRRIRMFVIEDTEQRFHGENGGDAQLFSSRVRAVIRSASESRHRGVAERREAGQQCYCHSARR